MSHVLFVAVVQECGAYLGGPEHPFPGLGPAGMVHIGIDIGLEAVFVRHQGISECGWLIAGKLDMHDGLDALVPVLPGYHQPNGGSVLLG